MSSALPDLQGRLEPKLWTVMREGISRAQLARDVLAGVSVGVVALPLGRTPIAGMVHALTLVDRIGAANVHGNIREALARARELVAAESAA